MTSARWQQIDQLFHATLECDSTDRATFLAQACEGDESLRREVESLIKAHQQSASFMEEPANDIAAELLSGRETALAAGMFVGHYQIVSLLSESGMGEVYLARDVRLGRQVAFKRLPAQFTLDADRVRRFEQEARAVSALNHPNIVTIHEIGRSNSLLFITTEFINGQTLRQCLAGRMTLDKVLDVATQIASALVAAHAAGIMHRDIKPENIMIRPDGYVKVLDFGLAKLVEQKNKSFLGLQESTVGQHQTVKGLILGTVNYMSPEQAKGEPTDQRTDIFSLGVVIYEMLTGRTPFAGDSTSETFANLINQAPQPLSRFGANVPEELQRIVLKLLRKDVDERYQTMKEVLADLKYLFEKLRSDGKLEQSVGPEMENRAAKSAVFTGEAKDLEPGLTRRTAERKLAPTNQVVESKPQQRVLLAAGLILVVAFAGVGYGLYRYSKNKAPFIFRIGEVTRLTSTGKVKATVISPDGKFTIYAQEEQVGDHSLWIQHVASSNRLQVAPSSNIRYQVLNITPDGSSIYYLDEKQSLYQIPFLGGSPKKIVDGLLPNSSIGFSPDGKRFTFVRRFESNASALFIINADGTNEQKLVSIEQPRQLTVDPAWSPDGKVIACPILIDGFFKIFTAQLADGKTSLISSEAWSAIRKLAWLPDSKSLIFIGTVKGNLHQLFQISYPRGEARQITQDLNDYDDFSLTVDGKSLAAVKVEQTAHLWIMPSSELALAKEITSGFGKYDGIYSLDWMSDSKILYTSSLGEDVSIWTITVGSGDPTLLKNGHYPAVSPDHRFIVYRQLIDSQVALFRMELSDKSERLLTKGTIHYPAFSPDGKWLVFTKYDGRMSLWKVPVEGGEATQILVESALCSRVSPDGKTIAFVLRRGGHPNRIALASIDGGKVIKIFDAVLATNPFSNNQNLQWTANGRSIYYIAFNNGVSNIWRQPIDGSAPVQVTRFETGRIFNFAFSADGKQLALSRGSFNSDVVLIKNSE
jgi:serine/threonine protein kinase